MSDAPRRRQSGLPPVVRTGKKGTNRPKKKSASSSSGVLIAGGIGAALLLIAGAYFLLRSGSSTSGGGDSGGGGLIASITKSINPFTDTPESLFKEVMKAIDDSRATIASIKDAPSRDAAIEKFRNITKRLNEIQYKLAKLPPLSNDEYKTLVDEMQRQKPDNSQDEREDLQKEFQRIATSGLITPEFPATISELVRAGQATQFCFVNGLKPLTEPKLDRVRAEHDFVAERREYLRRLAESKGDSEKIIALSTETEKRLAELTKQREGNSDPRMPAFSRYQTADNQCSSQIAQVIQYFEEQGNMTPAARQIAMGIQTTQWHSLAAQDFSRRRAMAAAAAPNSAASPNTPPTQPGSPAQAVPNTPLPTGPRGFPPGFPPDAAPPGGVPPLPGDPQHQVTVRITGGPFTLPTGVVTPEQRTAAFRNRAEQRPQFLERLSRLPNARVVKVSDSPTALEVTLSSPGSPAELAQKIDFAEVESVEESTRTIVLKVTDKPE